MRARASSILPLLLLFAALPGLPARAAAPKAGVPDPAAALRQLESASEAPTLPERAWSAFWDRDPASALELFREAAAASPGAAADSDLQFGLGTSLHALGRYSEAIPVLTRLIEIRIARHGAAADGEERQRRHRAARLLADCHERLGEPKVALRWIERARDEHTSPSWCGTCSAATDLAVEATVDRLSLAIGGKVAASHLARVAAFGWYGWLPLLGWLGAAVVVLRRTPRQWPRLAYGSIAVAAAVVGLGLVVDPSAVAEFGLWDPSFQELAWTAAVAAAPVPWALAFLGLLRLRRDGSPLARAAGTAGVAVLAASTLAGLVFLVIGLDDQFNWIYLRNLTLPLLWILPASGFAVAWLLRRRPRLAWGLALATLAAAALAHTWFLVTTLSHLLPWLERAQSQLPLATWQGFIFALVPLPLALLASLVAAVARRPARSSAEAP